MSTWGRRGVPRNIRNRILERDHHTCQLREFGCLVTATEVDDVIPVAVSGVPRTDATEAMLQAVCCSCHRRKTERERRAGHAVWIERRRQRRRLPSQRHPGD